MPHALVTGGSSGIGLEVARRLAGRGYDVTILARDRAKLEHAVAALLTARREGRQRVAAASADVARREELRAAIAGATQERGDVDLLVASAGIAHPGYFLEQADELFDRTMAVDYFGCLHAVRAVAPAMVRRRSGSIVLVGSGAGLVGVFGYTTYAPAKFALRGLAECLRAEMRPHGVHVAIAYPPDTDTPQLAAESATKPPETRAIAEGGGLWSAGDVAEAILRGVERRRFAIYPGWQMAALGRLHSLLAPLLASHFDRTAARAAGARPGPVRERE